MLTPFTRRLLALAVAGGLAPLAADAEEPTPVLPEITVYSERGEGPAAASQLAPELDARAASRDASALLEAVPGAAVVRNGAQTGIVELRGLFNERVKIVVDGLAITPACPNHMDPPLHYLTAEALDSIEVLPGVTPVSQGGDSIAGTVIANSAPAAFGADATFSTFGRVSGGYHGADSGTRALAEAGVHDRDLSVRYRGERLSGQDLNTPLGEVRDSGYNLMRQEAALATRVAGGVLRVDAGRHETWDTGTPALPMDIVSDVADKVALGYEGGNTSNALELRAWQHRIEHLMDNYSLRPATGMRMAAPTTSEDRGVRLGSRRTRGAEVYRLGVESFWNDFDGYQRNVASSAVQDLFRDARRDRLGAYGEWQSVWGERWQTQLGARVDRVQSDAGNIVSYFPANATFAAAFNAADHDIRDTDVEWAAQARYAASRQTSIELGLARKVRAPSLLERYLWSPSNASAGQADGRSYLGNLALTPEVSHQLNLGAVWQGDGRRVVLNAFYNSVRDYIQGTPHATLTDASGLPVLQYQNIGQAVLYGVDGNASLRVSETWRLTGTLGWVRGENRDNGDNLYRLAPLHADLAAEYRMDRWTHTLQWHLAASQTHVAAYNGETETPGYGVAHLRTRYRMSERASVAAGIENLFDKRYADALSGANRVSGGALPVGERIPGAGRAFYLAGEYNW